MVRVPWLDGSEEGAFTCGDDLADARRMASGLIDSWVSIYLLDRGTDLPTPGELPQGEGWELIRPSMSVIFALELRQLRKQAGISQAEAARRLGIKQPSYAVLEDPTRANPTLKTLERLSRAFGVAMDLDLKVRHVA